MGWDVIRPGGAPGHVRAANVLCMLMEVCFSIALTLGAL